MIKIENECVGCPPEMGCIGSSCPYIRVPHLYCDKCGADVDELFADETGEFTLCEECLVEVTPRISLRDVEML